MRRAVSAVAEVTTRSAAPGRNFAASGCLNSVSIDGRGCGF